MKLSKRCVPGAAETPVRSSARPSLPGTQGGFKSSCLPQTPPCSQPLGAAPLKRCCRCEGSCYPREMAISAPNEGWKRSAAQVGSIPGGSSPASPAQLGAGLDLIIYPACLGGCDCALEREYKGKNALKSFLCVRAGVARRRRCVCVEPRSN